MKNKKKERGFTRLTAPEASVLIKRRQVRILDMREPHAMAEDCIEGASHFGTAELEEAVRRSDKNDTILLYCYHGISSRVFAQTLADFGYTEVYDLIGGYDAWRNHLAGKRNEPACKPIAPISYAIGRWLTRHGFRRDDLASRAGNGNTSLMRACQLGDLAIATELIRCGAPLQSTNNDCNNALWLACFSGNLDLIDLLIAEGIDVDHQNHNGATCLMYAASASKPDVLIRLLVGGARLDLRSTDDLTALDMTSDLQCLQLLSAAEKRAKQKQESLAGC